MYKICLAVLGCHILPPVINKEYSQDPKLFF
jgi:hypothetical protein